MKKIMLGLFGSLLIFFGFGTFAAYQQQGFTQFQEINGKINFVCDSQCVVLVGPLAGSDRIIIQGAAQGTGMIGYGFVVGQQVVPADNLQLNGNMFVNQQYSFSTSPFYSQLPKNAQVVLIVQGAVAANQFNISLGFMGLFQKIGQKWTDFWTFDTFKPYTINLLKGPMMLGKSANSFFYILFILIVLYIFIFVKRSFQKKILYILYGGLTLWLIYDFRMGLEMIQYYRYDYQTYISSSLPQKIYRDRGDFYAFVDFSKDTLNHLGIPKFGQVTFYTDNSWPFPGSMKYLLYPYDIQINSGHTNYYMVYGAQSASRTGTHLFLSGTDLGSGMFYDFSPNAFIFVK